MCPLSYGRPVGILSLTPSNIRGVDGWKNDGGNSRGKYSWWHPRPNHAVWSVLVQYLVSHLTVVARFVQNVCDLLSLSSAALSVSMTILRDYFCSS